FIHVIHKRASISPAESTCCIQQPGYCSRAARQPSSDRLTVRCSTFPAQIERAATDASKSIPQALDLCGMQDLVSVACKRGVTVVTHRRILLGAPQATSRWSTEAQQGGTTRKAAL